MKKIIALLLILSMVFCFCACEDDSEQDTDSNVIKLGMVCIGDDNAAYDRNFYSSADAATERLAAEGIEIEWIYTYNHPEGDEVANDCIELAEAGCKAVFLNSYGQEPAMLTVAGDYPDTVFCALTNEGSKSDSLTNTVNAFPSIDEALFLAGASAGAKLNQLIDLGEITEDEAVIGYVGAYTFAEVISGYTAFYLGAKKVCPSATMLVEFIGSWGDNQLESAATQDLIDHGAVLISQHSDSTSPAAISEANKKYHVGYNIDMSDVAPNYSIISSTIDWTNYFVYVAECVANNEEVSQDYMQHGLLDGDVKLTDLNKNAAADNTQDYIDTYAEAIKNGELHVFDTSTFTVNGKEVTEAYVDKDADFVPDDTNAIFDGYYHESYFKSAPSFDLRIDGITLLNEAY